MRHFERYTHTHTGVLAMDVSLSLRGCFFLFFLPFLIFMFKKFNGPNFAYAGRRIGVYRDYIKKRTVPHYILWVYLRKLKSLASCIWSICDSGEAEW